MILTKSFWKRRIDKFILLLVFFTLLLLSLFFYLLFIEQDIKNYNTYQHKLEKMISLDHQLNSFYLKAYRYIDYDETTLVTGEFEENMNFLQKSSLKEEFGEHTYKDIEKVENAYIQKIYLLEQFKTLNARVTNSIHYLYDLRKTIDKIHVKDSIEETLLDQIFFTIGQSLMDIPFNEIELIKNLKALNSYSKEHKEFAYFYQHSKQFLSDMKMIKKTAVENKKIQLCNVIKHVIVHLEETYIVNKNKHSMVTFSFFLLAFLILIILMFNYRRVLKNTHELFAFRYAVEHSDNSIVITDKNRQIEYVNDAFEEHTGYVRNEVLGSNPSVLKSDLMSDDFYKTMNETLNQGEKWQGEFINKRKDGALLYEKASIVPIFIEDELVQYLAIKLDITEYVEQHKRLQQSAAVFEMTADGIIITDKEKKIFSVNAAYVNMFGYEEEELLGKEPTIVDDLKEDVDFHQNMWNKLLKNDRWAGKIHNRTKSGKIIPVWLTVTIVRDPDGEIQNFIAIYANLEEIIEMEEKVSFLAYHDNLTKLPNRAHFEKEIVGIFDITKTNKEKAAILFIDLDRFKVINDTLGHYIGDGMLIELSKRIQKILGENDIFARMGGDEFIIVLNPLKKRENASEVAKQILSIIRKPMDINGYHLHTTASIGIAIYPDDGEEKSEILKHADSAMYYAKDEGKDNYKFYTKKLSYDVQERLSLEQELLNAVSRNEFTLQYQPQYNLLSGKIIGAEALLRWNNTNLGLVSPENFIPVAEEIGVIIEIGYFVFEEACREYMRWKEEGMDIERIAINLSTVQFQQDNMFETLINIMEKTGISPHNIELEITEGLIMQDSLRNLVILEELRGIGCTISIDDFGTGYSSMSYMKSFPLDAIKIDKSFIADLPHDTHDAEVSKAIIALSKSLGYQVIAEGIENISQEDFLIEHHCDTGQGYYFAKPMTGDKFISFYHQKNK